VAAAIFGAVMALTGAIAPSAASAAGPYTGIITLRPLTGVVFNSEASPVTGQSDGTYVTVQTDGWGFRFGTDNGVDALPTGTYNSETLLPSGRFPTLEIVIASNACFTSGWTVTILEPATYAADGALESFAADLVDPCGNTPVIASIRLNAAVGTRVVRTTAALDFPGVLVGQQSSSLPVVVENLGSDAVPITPSLGGTDAADFVIGVDGCSTSDLAPGQSCSIDVRFEPKATTAKAALVAVGSSELLASSLTHVAGRGLSTLTLLPVRLAISSDSGDWVGDGDHSVTDPAVMTPVNVSGYVVNGQSQVVSIDSPNAIDRAHWTFEFVAPEGAVLGLGSYEVPAGGWLSVSGFGHGCSTTTGGFEVLDGPVFDTDGRLLVFAADFNQHCEGLPAELRGSIRFHSRVALTDLAPPSGTVAIEAGDVGTNKVGVSVAIPATDPSGLAAAATSTDGASWTMQPYAASVAVTLPAGEGTRTVWTRWKDGAGNWSPAATDTIVLDSVAPGATSIAIASGAAYSRSTVVSLSTPASDGLSGVTHVALSNDGRTWTTRPYAATQSWTLAATNGTRTVYAKWQDGAGNWSTVLTDTIVLDSVAPGATAPGNAFIAGASLDAGRTLIRLSWTGTDVTSGIARYEIGQSTDGAAFAIIGASPSSPNSSQALATGHTYRFRVRAVDRAGNVGPWLTGRDVRLSAAQESSSKITYSGTWRAGSNSGFWGGKTRYASKVGAKATFKITGRSFAWIATTGSTRGSARIYVNGRLVQTVNLHAATTHDRRVVFVKTWATSSTRTIVIRVRGTSGHPRVDLDGLVWGS
jgi:hypothetical protein